TIEHRRDFCRALAEHGRVSLACDAVGLSRQSAYALRARRDGRTFAVAWDAALLIARQRLIDDAIEMARDGVIVTITKTGDVTERRTRDPLKMLEFAARLAKPDLLGYDLAKDAEMVLDELISGFDRGDDSEFSALASGDQRWNRRRVRESLSRIWSVTAVSQEPDLSEPGNTRVSGFEIRFDGGQPEPDSDEDDHENEDRPVEDYPEERHPEKDDSSEEEGRPEQDGSEEEWRDAASPEKASPELETPAEDGPEVQTPEVDGPEADRACPDDEDDADNDDPLPPPPPALTDSDRLWETIAAKEQREYQRQSDIEAALVANYRP
ncbi:MAG: hypothetical protein RL367_995, partial [Pseudomonadota bacterium]